MKNTQKNRIAELEDKLDKASKYNDHSDYDCPLCAMCGEIINGTPTKYCSLHLQIAVLEKELESRT